MDKETQQRIQEMQILEQNLHSLQSQRQAFQMESNETANALNEVKNTDDDVYKVVAGVMVKVKKDDAQKDLEEKEKMLNLRLESIEKQEKLLEDKAKELREATQKALEPKEESK